MDLHAEPATVLPFENTSYYDAEDSGYLTSFTPGSIGSKLCDEILDQIRYYPERDSSINCKYPYTTLNGSACSTPLNRRGVKRPNNSEHEDNYNTSVSTTPTSFIAGKIQCLEVSDNKENAILCFSPKRPKCSSNIITEYGYEAYPLTPVKNKCKAPCKSPRKYEFKIHSLLCKKLELQPSSYHTPPPEKPLTITQFQKLDIILMLSKKSCIPAIKNIFSCLSGQDISNLNLVSGDWSTIWDSCSTRMQRKRYGNYLKNLQENQENKALLIKETTTPIKNEDTKLRLQLKERAKNELNFSSVRHSAIHSPPTSPRTNRFKKFTKSASLDCRVQLPCVRCHQPAKVTEEATGEVWLECTNSTCCYKFCKFCNCSRHPGKCFQYDLTVPSPSKRKRNTHYAGTKKSKRNLQRLLYDQRQ